ncbi:MAG: hypothetical protein HY831_04280 [Candidatus Aenigmarchaeota archaeon]|nr:hypothetical protein [Candidatus Aenigmarchaeota archaeon]
MYMRPNMAFDGYATVGDVEAAVFRDRFDPSYRVALDFKNGLEFVERNGLWVYENPEIKDAKYAMAS